MANHTLLWALLIFACCHWYNKDQPTRFLKFLLKWSGFPLSDEKKIGCKIEMGNFLFSSDARHPNEHWWLLIIFHLWDYERARALCIMQVGLWIMRRIYYTLISMRIYKIDSQLFYERKYLNHHDWIGSPVLAVLSDIQRKANWPQYIFEWYILVYIGIYSPKYYDILYSWRISMKLYL